MSLSAPTWVAAIATVALAVGVIVAAVVARKALSAHVRQLAAQHELTRQLAEAMDLQAQNLRVALDERRRAQACQVFIDLKRAGEPGAGEPGAGERGAGERGAGEPGDAIAATVHNNSSQPIYDLYVIWQLGTTRMGRPDPAARLLPGQQVSFERSAEPADGEAEAADQDALTAFLTFRDAAGIRWTVREDGTLSDISPTP